MELVGLQDDYVHDGRVITEVLNSKTLPKSLKSNSTLLAQLGQAYKQINAPFGALGMASLKVSTTALSSNSPNDLTYLDAENQIEDWTVQRNSIATQMRQMLHDAEFGGQAINVSDARELIKAANSLIAEAQKAAM